MKHSKSFMGSREEWKSFWKKKHAGDYKGHPPGTGV